MEGDEISVLLLAPHLLHCPVSFLVLTMRTTLNTYFIVITKSLPLSAVVPGLACTSVYIRCVVSEYSEPGCAGVMHLPPAFYSARFCSGDDASFVLAELEQEMAGSGVETWAKLKDKSFVRRELFKMVDFSYWLQCRLLLSSTPQQRCMLSEGWDFIIGRITQLCLGGSCQHCKRKLSCTKWVPLQTQANVLSLLVL